MFQSTRPRGARPGQLAGHVAALAVSIHAPAWGATCRTMRLSHLTGLFQSTRPCGARRQQRLGIDAFAHVSIHAPVRGATRIRSKHYARSTVSIHAPAWGATTAVTGMVPAASWFQSTRPRGARRPCRPTAIRSGSRFNPRARVGRDTGTSRSRRRGNRYFNPRARVGRDLDGLQARIAPCDVSIHAPAWGATPGRSRTRCTRAGGFNPRARVGRDPIIVTP